MRVKLNVFKVRLSKARHLHNFAAVKATINCKNCPGKKKTTPSAIIQRQHSLFDTMSNAHTTFYPKIE